MFVICLTPGLEPMTYHTRGKHANHYTTDAVGSRGEIKCKEAIAQQDKLFEVIASTYPVFHRCIFILTGK